MERFDKLVIGIIALLIIAIAGVIFSNQMIGLAVPEIPGENGAEIGVNGPFRLKFSSSMDVDSVNDRLTITPETSGTIVWKGTLLEFFPDKPLQVGVRYTVSIQPGARSVNRRELTQPVHLTYSTRHPRVTFLKPILDSPEVWLFEVPGGMVRQLTNSGGNIFDYNTHPEGRFVVYSYPNDKDGIDLWLLSTDTMEVEKILDCGINWCLYPSISHRAESVAFSQRSRIDEDSAPGFPKIYILSLQNRSVARLYDDPQITGFDPLWSPDGSKLAFFDGSISAIRVHNFLNNGSVQLPSQMGRVGSWSPDGNRLIFNDIQYVGGLGKVIVYLADLQAEDIIQVLDFDPALEFSNPIWSPDGKWIASTARYTGSGNDQQLVLIDALTFSVRWITQDSRYTFSSHQWIPSSDALVYQRFELGSSQFEPDVWIWDLMTWESRLVSEQAGMPRWLP